MYNSKWFNSLIKPFLNPPASIFKPVWGILYILIIVSFVLYALKHSEINKLKGYIFFGIQMILNGLWSPVFFYFKNMTLAFVIIILMDIFVLLTIKEFYKISKTASFLLIPYFIWILFATYLNFGFIFLNRV